MIVSIFWARFYKIFSRPFSDPSLDICSNSTQNLSPGITFIRSPIYPSEFEHYQLTNCFLDLRSPSNFTIYIQKKKFQNSHIESLSFISNRVTDTFYGDDSRPGPFVYNTRRLVVKFETNSFWNGKSIFSIQVSGEVQKMCASYGPDFSFWCMVKKS